MTESQNTGSHNTGSHNTGSQNTDLHNTESQNTESHNTGSQNTDLQNNDLQYDIDELRRCKRCLLYELADKSQYESVKNYIDSIPASEKADEKLYHERLDICKQCDMLLSGMCRKCGCYVEVRAALIKSSCPKTVPAWK